ncbi:MAG: xanthine dehydrogenase family protein molybdopterin-binding subunit [Pseudomonadota bacterium]
MNARDTSLPTRETFTGARAERVEDARLLTGQGRYLDDLRLPSVLHVAFVRSSHAHARIAGIDMAQAKALPGVIAVFTAADLGPLAAKRMPVTVPHPQLVQPRTQFPLAVDEVCYVGEPVAMVVATSRYVAEDAVAMVEVDYDGLSVASDARAALAAGAGLAHLGAPDNLVGTVTAKFGDVDAAFAAAGVVVRERIEMHRGGCHSMEGRAVAAAPPEDAEPLTVWTSTQSPYMIRRFLAAHLEWDESRIRVIAPDVGGGFGPKAIFYPEEVAVPLAAMRLGRTLKWVEDRREHFLATTQQREQWWELEVAAARDGRITAIRGRAVHDNGAYVPYGLLLAQSTVWQFPGPYAIGAVDLAMDVVFTNKVATTPVRGAGRPYAAFVIERCVDWVARALEMDPAEVRRRNYVRREQFPYQTGMVYRDGSMATYDSGDFEACLDKALALAGHADFAQRRAAAREQGLRRGIGVASYIEDTGVGPFEGVTVRVLPSGGIQVVTGAAAQGQGHATILAQICADALGVRPDQVSVESADTGKFPHGLGTFGSRIAVTAGSSAYKAAGEVRAKALAVASRILECPAAELDLREGRVVRLGEATALSLGELARRLAGAPGVALPGEPGLEATGYEVIRAPATASGTHVAEVEIDVATGGVKVVAYAVAHDCGRMLNPLLVEGQIIGGVVHGIGNALFERMVYDENGQPLSTNYGEYLLPMAGEMPRIRLDHVETPSPLNPLGAKGAGEGGTIPAAAAVIAAVEDALREYGAVVRRHPLSPQDIVELIAAATGGAAEPS